MNRKRDAEELRQREAERAEEDAERAQQQKQKDRMAASDALDRELKQRRARIAAERARLAKEEIAQKLEWDRMKEERAEAAKAAALKRREASGNQ